MASLGGVGTYHLVEQPVVATGRHSVGCHVATHSARSLYIKAYNVLERKQQYSIVGKYVESSLVRQ